MYCPQCGQERVSEATSFCSRCGYLLTGTAELIKTGGRASDKLIESSRSPRSRGIRQGLFMLLLMIVVAPIVGMTMVFALGNDPWPVGLAILLFGGGGILRIAYALMFEAKTSGELAAASPTELNPPSAFSTAQLPPRQDIPATDYISPLGSSDPDIVRPGTPGSVTDATTRLLEKELDDKR